MFSCLLTKGHGLLETLSPTMPSAGKQFIRMIHFCHSGSGCWGHLALVGQHVGYSSTLTGALIRLCTDKSDNRQGLERATYIRLCLYTAQSRLSTRWMEVLEDCHGDGAGSLT